MTDVPEPFPIPIDQLASELDELARHAPSKLAQRVAQLSVRQQAEIALRLEPRRRMELLLHAPKPLRLVRALPASDWYVTVREIGPADALGLIKLASVEQLIHLFDLEVWRGDRFDGDRAGAWLAVFLEAGEPAIRRFLRHADDEVLALLFKYWLRVEPLVYEDGADVHGHGLGDAGTAEGRTMPDGYHRFSPTISDHGPLAHRLLQLFYVDQPVRYQRAVWDSMWELPSELEEAALQWRRSRLEDHGYPSWEEALEVYAPPGEPSDPSGLPLSGDRDGLPASRRALMPNWGPSSLAAATDCLSGEQRERVLHETVSLANRLLVADGADPGEPEHHRQALAKAAGFIGIASELHGAATPQTVARLLGERPAIELFREGWARATALQRQAAELVASGWGVDHPDPLRAIDPPLDERLRALLEKRPRYVEVSAEELSGHARDFRTLAELEETRAVVEMARCVGSLMFGELGWELGPLDEPHRLSTMFLTSLARHSVETTCSVGALDQATVAVFLRTVGSRRTAAPDAAERALERFVGALAKRSHLAARETALLLGFGRFSLERLMAECGGLDPGVPPDPRFVPCLILESGDG